ITQLYISFNEIMSLLYVEVKNDVIVAKQYFRKESHFHLEIVFMNQKTLKKYATRGIKILNKSYYGYIPTNLCKLFFLVKVRNVHIRDRESISTTLKEAFDDIGRIVSIKSLLIE
ncbi:27342_t:CDS:1, partial [Gigaspora margarita]